MAYGASSGAGQVVRVYLPGSELTVSSAFVAELGRTFTCSLTAGACETTVRPPFHTKVGHLINATNFRFDILENTNIANNEFLIPITSGGAFSAGNVIVNSASTGKFFAADNTSIPSGRDILIALGAASGADQTVLAYRPGSRITGLAGLTDGTAYYVGTSGGLSTTPAGKWNIQLGVAINGAFHFNPVGKILDHAIVEEVTAGAVWSAGNFLYLARGTGRYSPAISTSPEAGIAEIKAIAVATQSGGNGTRQLVYQPGSIIRGLYSLGAGERYFTGSVSGSSTATVPPSYDQFYSIFGHAIDQDAFKLEDVGSDFLPSGIQEKGFCAAYGTQTVGTGSVPNVGNGVNFRKVMSFTPTSITLTLVASTGTFTGPTVTSITRFGFAFYIRWGSGLVDFNWNGTYQTAGN